MSHFFVVSHYLLWWDKIFLKFKPNYTDLDFGMCLIYAFCSGCCHQFCSRCCHSISLEFYTPRRVYLLPTTTNLVHYVVIIIKLFDVRKWKFEKSWNMAKSTTALTFVEFCHQPNACLPVTCLMFHVVSVQLWQHFHTVYLHFIFVSAWQSVGYSGEGRVGAKSGSAFNYALSWFTERWDSELYKCLSIYYLTQYYFQGHWFNATVNLTNNVWLGIHLIKRL